MSLLTRSVGELLAAFRSSDPTPGGGSASALAGAIGAALLAMVAGLPKPRAATSGDTARLEAAGERCGQLADVLASLVDRDSEAYEAVVAAYRLPKNTDEEKRARASAVQRALHGAIEAPLDVMRAADEAIEQAAVVAALGNPSASSDVQVALELLRAAIRGARLNVEINLGSVKDPGYADRVRSDVARLSSAAT